MSSLPVSQVNLFGYRFVWSGTPQIEVQWYANQQMSELKTFGAVIAEARKALGLSQKDVAAQIRKEDGDPISPQYFNDIERDRRNAPSQHLILELARVLKLQPDYLFALAQAWPRDIVESMGKASPAEVERAFSAFRRTFKVHS